MKKINIFLDDLNGGLYQWDTGQKLRLYGVEAGVRVDYVRVGQTLSVDTYEEDGNVYANIPNILLQLDGGLRVLVYVTGADSGETVVERTLRVHPRPKPSDYIYTETEIRQWDDLAERVEELEKHPVSEDTIASAVGKYLDENPVVTEETDPTVPEWAKQPEKPTYTAEEVGALPDTTRIPTVPENISDFENDAGYLTQDTLQAATDAALAQAKESGEFDGVKGDKGDPGDTGATPDLQIGTVETLAAGSNAKASITGTPENPILHLGIPRGADGKDGTSSGDGSGGTDVALGMTGAEVGQIAKITAVDDDGKPTAWEPVDYPGKWKKLGEILLDAEGQEFPIVFSITAEQAQEYDGFLVNQVGLHGGEYISSLAMKIGWGSGATYTWNWSNHAWGSGMLWYLLPRDPHCADKFSAFGFSWGEGGNAYTQLSMAGATISRNFDFKIYIECSTETPIFTDGCGYELWGLKGVRT